MTVNKSRYCNGCGLRVAVKYILWNTLHDYVTLRGDDAPTYANMEDAITPVRVHYCRSCWCKITDCLQTVETKEPNVFG